MHKLYVFVLFFVASVALSQSSVYVSAVDVSVPPTPASYAPIFISGFQVTDQVDGIEIYNESSEPVDLSTWSVQYNAVAESKVCAISLSDWLLPGDYVLAVADNGGLADLMVKNDNIRSYNSCLRSTMGVFSFTLNSLDGSVETITPTISPTPNAYVRKGLTKTYRTNEFAKDFALISDPKYGRSLYAGTWYRPAESTQLQFSEILVNSRNCSPLESTADCSDYVKLYNPTDQPVNLADYRIRNGYLGQSPSTSNTTMPSGLVEPGHFAVIPMTVTNSASWLWLEDVYGVKRYDNTVQDYPDASSDTKKGQVWAYDSIDGTWTWSTQPTPLDSPSVFPPLATVPAVVTEKPMVPCAEGQYRSEETNRCRSVVSEVASLIPCGPGQERNPTTNRCRSTSAVLGVTDLAPCKAGQERNPATNRCRSVTGSIPQAEYAPKQTDQNSNNFVMWMSLAAVGAIAVGYAIWEWRSELVKGYRKLFGFLKPSK